MITIISIAWLLNIVSLLLGYFLGKGTLSKTTYEEIKKQVEYKVLPHYRQPSGIIQRPSASKIFKMQHPELEEEEEEMKKTLDNGIQPLTP